MIESASNADHRTMHGSFEVGGRTIKTTTALAIIERGAVKKADPHVRPYRHCPEDRRYRDFHWIAA